MRLSAAFFVALAVLTVCLLPFAVVDVGAMESETRTDSSAVTDWVNDSTARVEEGLFLHVRGDGPRDRVAAQLEAAFEARGVPVTVVDSLDRQYEGNVLVVTLGERTGSYTPFRASGTQSWAYFYTTTGNTTTIDDESRVIVVEEGDDTSRFYFQIGEVRLTDESDGVFSYPAYQRHLTVAHANAVADTVAGVERPTGAAA